MLKVITWPWLSFSKQILIRSFKWDTVHSCRSGGCKNIRGQSWRSKKSAVLARFDSDAPGVNELADFFWPPNLTSHVLQPIDLKERKVPRLKDLIHICLETKAKGFAWLLMCVMLAQITPISKQPYTSWPLLQSAYFGRGCIANLGWNGLHNLQGCTHTVA